MRVQALAMRVLGGESFETGHRGGVPAEGELGLHGELDRLDPALVELRDIGLGEGGIAEVGQSVGAPQRERFAEQARSRRRIVACKVLPPDVDQRSEAVDVELVGSEPHDIRPRPGREDGRLRRRIERAT